jgi:hypothetical protein
MTMAIKEDLVVCFPSDNLQDFEDGKEIEQKVYYTWVLKSGDRLRWICGQRNGIAEVVSCRKTPFGLYCVFKKVLAVADST